MFPLSPFPAYNPVPPSPRFRTSIKSLERRLASVLNQAFQDSPTLRWRFRFLDCFSDIMQRPAIAEELREQHTIMIQDFAAEVISVMRASVMFFAQRVTTTTTTTTFSMLCTSWSPNVDMLLLDVMFFALDVGNVFSLAMAFLAPTEMPVCPLYTLKPRIELGRSRAQF